MDDAERYPQKHYSLNHHSIQSTSRSKLPIRNASYPLQIRNEYVEEEDDDDGEDSRENDGFDDDDGEEDEVNGEDDGEEEDEEQNGCDNVIEDDDDGRYQKKRKLKNLVSDYEFAPRVNVVKQTFSARNSNLGGDWSEHATSVLLESWGGRYLQLGRRSLRSEDWVEVAEKVSEECKIEKTEIESRNHLDMLKKKYKKEKEKLNGSGSKWAYFKKMDMLMTSPGRQQMGLPCGVDAGEYVFMNPGVYLDRSNGLDEMRDSPGESESSKAEEEEDSDGPPPKKSRGGGDEDEGSSFRVLADSIQKFGEIYEKIENSKRQQMMELEKMRMDFHRELDLQKKQILERAQAEIAKIRQGDDEDSDESAENPSGSE